MAPFRDDSDSDEAPEAFTLSQTKGVAKKRNAALRELEAAEKQKQKTKNRERDRKLKEQASQSVKRRKVDVEEEENDDESGGELDSGVEARMLRAMQQADEEESDVDVESGGENDEEDEDEEEEEEEESDLDVEGGSENEKDSNDDEEEDAEMEEAFDEVMDDVPSKANRLPDHLFTSTFTSKPTKDPLASSKITQQKKKKIRRKRSGNAPKDIIIGSRTVRTLSHIDGAPKASAAMVPSAKVKKFLDKSLSIKGNKSRTRGWERRPANIGSMRRQGPAAHFVRGS